jgi:FtsH-binding integral membrane protein
MGFAKSSTYKLLFGDKNGGKSAGRHSLGYHQYNLMGGKGGIGSKSNEFLKLFNEKKKFMVAVFVNLFVQLAITYYVMTNYNKLTNNTQNKPLSKPLFWSCFILSILVIFVMALVPMSQWLKLLLFTVFSILTGIISVAINNSFIQSLILGTIAIFAVLVLFGVTLIYFGIQLGERVASILFYLLLLLIFVEISTLYMHTSSLLSKGICVASLMLFSVFVVYDTNTILQRNYYGDFITASLDYYLDVLNIFVNLANMNRS